jgi:hypothetical protein
MRKLWFVRDSSVRACTWIFNVVEIQAALGMKTVRFFKNNIRLRIVSGKGIDYTIKFPHDCSLP